jgi:predicted transcriptional regulator
MKANATYKMSKQSKIYKAVNWNRTGLGSIMRALVEAEILEKIQPRGRREQKGTDPAQ